MKLYLYPISPINFVNSVYHFQYKKPVVCALYPRTPYILCITHKCCHTHLRCRSAMLINECIEHTFPSVIIVNV